MKAPLLSEIKLIETLTPWSFILIPPESSKYNGALDGGIGDPNNPELLAAIGVCMVRMAYASSPKADSTFMLFELFSSLQLPIGFSRMSTGLDTVYFQYMPPMSITLTPISP
jgi:hypothetical protein